MKARMLLSDKREICYRYNAWENELEELQLKEGNSIEFNVQDRTRKSWIIIFDTETPDCLKKQSTYTGNRRQKSE